MQLQENVEKKSLPVDVVIIYSIHKNTFFHKHLIKNMSNWATSYFGDSLLTKDGVKPTADVLNGKSRVGIYFSAHWVSFWELLIFLGFIYFI